MDTSQDVPDIDIDIDSSEPVTKKTKVDDGSTSYNYESTNVTTTSDYDTSIFNSNNNTMNNVDSYNSFNIPSVNSNKLKEVSDYKSMYDNDVKNLLARDISIIIISLNNIMKATSNELQPFLIENYPDIITNLGILLDAVNTVAPTLFPTMNDITHPSDYYEELNKQENVWPIENFISGNHAFRVVAKGLHENSYLLLILHIIRNLSFEYLNESFISNSSILMKHIVSIFHTIALEGGVNEITNVVTDIIINIGNRIDLNGKRRHEKSNTLEDMTLQDKKARSLSLLKISNHYNIHTLLEYRKITYSLLSFITVSLQQSKDRLILMRALDLFLKLASFQDNSAVFNNCPQIILDLLVELLCVSYSTVDPLQQVENNVIMLSMQSTKPLTRVPACVMSFFTEVNDSEVREGALEVIYALCLNSKKLQSRLASTTKCITLLYRVLESKVGRTSNQSIHRATLILQFFSQAQQNISPFFNFRNEFTLAAFTDTTFSELRCQNYYDIFNKNPNKINENEF